MKRKIVLLLCGWFCYVYFASQCNLDPEITLKRELYFLDKSEDDVDIRIEFYK